MNWVAGTSEFLLLSLISNVLSVEQSGVCLLQGSSRMSLTLKSNDIHLQSERGNDNENARSLLGNHNVHHNKHNLDMVVQFEPERWNHNRAVLRSHNCYEYSLNDLDSQAAHHCSSMLHHNPLKIKQCRRWFHIPGYRYHQHDLHEAVRFNRSVITCENMLERVALDGQGVLLWSGPNMQPTKKYGTKAGKSWKHDDSCPQNSYMAALVVQPKKRFHFYRRDHMCLDKGNQNKRCWSHKPGILNATRFDASGHEIVNLFKADRKYGKHSYNEVCGFFCVPSNNMATTHSEFYRGGKTKWHWAAV